jgi:hypothetical protein
MKFWQYWFIGGKMFLASLVGGVVLAVIYVLGRLVANIMGLAGTVLIGVLGLIAWILLVFAINGYFANLFWRWK